MPITYRQMKQILNHLTDDQLDFPVNIRIVQICDNYKLHIDWVPSTLDFANVDGQYYPIICNTPHDEEIYNEQQFNEHLNDLQRDGYIK